MIAALVHATIFCCTTQSLSSCCTPTRAVRSTEQYSPPRSRLSPVHPVRSLIRWSVAEKNPIGGSHTATQIEDAPGEGRAPSRPTSLLSQRNTVVEWKLGFSDSLADPADRERYTPSRTSQLRGVEHSRSQASLTLGVTGPTRRGSSLAFQRFPKDVPDDLSILAGPA